MRIIVRAFNEENYHKDIVIMDEVQVRQHDVRVGEASDSMSSGLVGTGVSIDPRKFPEMSHFEIVIER